MDIAKMRDFRNFRDFRKFRKIRSFVEGPSSASFIFVYQFLQNFAIFVYSSLLNFEIFVIFVTAFISGRIFSLAFP